MFDLSGTLLGAYWGTLQTVLLLCVVAILIAYRMYRRKQL